jgi:outer membrane murein-binding lipoprotein Lpp
MTWIKKTFRIWPLYFVLLTGLVLAGCEGSDSREKIDDTVKEFSGQKSLERMDQMKKDIDDINKKQADRLKKIE